MAKRLVYTAINDILLILAGTAVGLAALLAVHFLPVVPMRENAFWSLEMIEKEFEDKLVVTGYPSTLKGNFTDCLMLEYAVYDPEIHGVLRQALRMYRAESYEGEENGWQPGRSLSDYLRNVPQPREVEYARYWHGYLVLLKPLLFLTSFNAIRLFNSALQLFLAGLVVIGMCRKGAFDLAKGFLFSIPFLFFVSSYASLSLSICLYVMFAALVAQFGLDQMLLKRNWYGYFFLTVGMATAYFDFLTYPLITLAFPLCAYLYLNECGGGEECRLPHVRIQRAVAGRIHGAMDDEMGSGGCPCGRFRGSRRSGYFGRADRQRGRVFAVCRIRQRVSEEFAAIWQLVLRASLWGDACFPGFLRGAAWIKAQKPSLDHPVFCSCAVSALLVFHRTEPLGAALAVHLPDHGVQRVCSICGVCESVWRRGWEWKIGHAYIDYPGLSETHF